MIIQLQWSAKPGRNGNIWKTNTPLGEIKISQRLYLHHYVWQVTFPDGSLKREDDLNKAKVYAEAWTANASSSVAPQPPGDQN